MLELPPEVRAQGALFLFDIGRWAAAELKERWTVKRKQQDTEKTVSADLTGLKDEVEKGSQLLLDEAATELGVKEVEEVLGLLERKHNLVLEWMESKVDNEEEYNRQSIRRDALRLRQKELDQKIAGTIAETEADLKRLGIQVEKQELEKQ